MNMKGYLALLLFCPALAFAHAGEVRFVKGDVHIERGNGQRQPLERGFKIEQGDTIVTGKDGYVQIAMIDEAVLAVRPDSRVKLETYLYSGQDTGQEKGILSLIRGSLRSITGLIGRKNRDSYSVRTPTATIGIRGTDHDVYFIPPPLPGQTPIGEPGTYDKVNTGETFIDTGNGKVFIQANQAGFAPAAAGSVPVKLAQIPSFMKTTQPILPPSRQEGGDKQKPGSPSSQNQGPSQPSGQPAASADTLPPPPPPPLAQSSTGSTPPAILQPLQAPTAPLAPLPQSGTLDPQNLPAGSMAAPNGMVMAGGDLSSGVVGNGAAFIGNPQEPFAAILDGSGRPISISGGNFQYSRDSAADVFPGSATVGGSTINWGIYAGGTIQDGMGVRYPQYFHYMIGGQATTPASLLTAMPTNGATYIMNTIVGYTKPITESGNIGGSVNSLNITLQNVGGAFNVSNYTISVTDADARTWNGYLISPVPIGTFVTGGNGSNLTVSCSGCPGGMTAGKASGSPIGNPISGMISSYSMTQGTAGVTGGVLSKQ